MAESYGLPYEVVIGLLQERGNCGRFVVLACAQALTRARAANAAGSGRKKNSTPRPLDQVESSSSMALSSSPTFSHVRHQGVTPIARPKFRRVSTLEKPSIRKASRYSVCPEKALATSAVAKRLLTRAPSVR